MSATSPDDASSVPTPTFIPAQTSPLPLGLVQRAPHHVSPARMVPCAATSVTSPNETWVSATSQEPTLIADALTRIGGYSAPLAPAVRTFLLIQQIPALPVSLLLLRFAVPGTDMTPAPTQPQPDVVVTQQYPSSPGSRLLTPLYDLAEFESANSSVAMSESLDIASVVPSDVLPIVDRLMPLNPQGSTQESPLSSEQLSPNRVRSDFDVDTVDLYPMFAASQRSVGDIPLIFPILSPELLLSPVSPAARSLQVQAYESVGSAGLSPATSMSITDRAMELQMTPPLIPLPGTINVQTDPALLLQITTASTGSCGQPAAGYVPGGAIQRFGATSYEGSPADLQPRGRMSVSCDQLPGRRPF